MKLIKKILCNLFGHRWSEWTSPEKPKSRTCLRCKLLNLHVVFDEDNSRYEMHSFIQSDSPTLIEAKFI